MIKRLVRGMVIVAVMHCCIGFLLYGARVKRQYPSIFDSDMLVFLFPFILALIGYFGVYWYSGFLAGRTRRRVIVASIIAIVTALVSGMFTISYSIFNYGE